MASVENSWEFDQASAATTVSGTVTITEDTTRLIAFLTKDNGPNEVSSVVLDPGGVAADFSAPVVADGWPTSGGAITLRELVSTGLPSAGDYTVEVTLTDPRVSTLVVLALSGTSDTSRYAVEENQSNGFPAGISLEGAGDLMLSFFVSRENRTESATGDLDTLVIDATPQANAVMRVDSGTFSTRTGLANYSFGSATGFWHAVLTISPLSTREDPPSPGAGEPIGTGRLLGTVVTGSGGTRSHTLIPGSNRIVVAYFGGEAALDGTPEATYGGQPMTLAVGQEHSSFAISGYLFYILEADLPANGVNSLSPSGLTLGAGSGSWVGCWEGLEQAAPVLTGSGEAVADSCTVQLGTVPAGGLVAMGVATRFSGEVLDNTNMDTAEYFNGVAADAGHFYGHSIKGYLGTLDPFVSSTTSLSNAIGVAAVFSPVLSPTTKRPPLISHRTETPQRKALFRDDFDRANGTLGSDWTSVANFNDLAIFGNEVYGGSVGSCAETVASGTQDFDPDQWAEITLTTLAGDQFDWGGLVIRMDPATGNGYVMDTEYDSAHIHVCTAGVLGAVVCTANRGHVAGDVLRVEAEGTEFRLFLNDELVATGTDSTYTSGQPGAFYVWGNVRAARQDGFYAGNVLKPVRVRTPSRQIRQGSVGAPSLKPPLGAVGPGKCGPEWDWFWRRAEWVLCSPRPETVGRYALPVAEFGGVEEVPTPSGTALFFDESADYLTVSGGPAQAIPSGDWALVFHLRLGALTGTSFQYIYSFGTFGASPSLNVYLSEASSSRAQTFSFAGIDDGGFTLGPSGGVLQTTTVFAPFSEVVLILQRRDGVTEAYANGEQIGSATRIFGAVTRGDAPQIGRRADGGATNYFGGNLYYAGQFDRAFTPEEGMQISADPFGPIRRARYALETRSIVTALPRRR